MTPGEGTEGLAEPLRSRWSPSSFDPDHVPDDAVVERLLQAARWAPSWGNRQSTRLVVLRAGTPGHAAFLARLRRGNAGWVPTAPLVVLVALQREAEPAAAGAASSERGGGRDFAVYDAGQAAAHLTLQARAEGLEAHQLAGFDHAGVAVDLGAPPTLEVLVAIALGRHRPPELPELAEREARPRERRPLAELARDGGWRRAWGDPPEVG
ncbi:nitroreductase family protein [Nocardioides sp.]|uniref:nitroreductase family protein n=1 Tax=Nocardioides sp. TaxID=35761 RepID=UPI003512A436